MSETSTQPSPGSLAIASGEAMPAHIVRAAEGHLAAGLEMVRSKDVEIPRALLMQSLSPQVAQEGKYKPGDVVHNIADKLLAEPGQKLRIVVAKHYLRWIEWIPRDKGGGIKAMTTDPNDDLVKRCEAGEKINDPTSKAHDTPAVIEYHCFVCILPVLGMDQAVEISCGKTNWKHGKNLVSRMLMRGSGIPCFAGAYTVRTENEKNKRNEVYKVWKFDNDGWSNPDEYKAAEQLNKFLKDKTIKTKMDEKEGDGEGVLDEKEM